MSNLAYADEIMDEMPRFTKKEIQRIRNFVVPDGNKFVYLPRKRKGQNGSDAARERAEWRRWHAEDLRRMERLWG